MVNDPNASAVPLIPDDEIGARPYHAYGGQAVDLHANNTHYAAAMAEMGITAAAGEYHEVYQHNREQVAAELSWIRTEIRGLDANGRSILDNYLAGYFPPPKHGAHVGLSEVLSESEGEEADLLLLDVLRWHHDMLAAQHQSERFRKAVDADKQEYFDYQEELIQTGWVSPHAREVAHRVTEVEVLVGDVWFTLIRQLDGYRQIGQDSVVIAQGTARNLHESEDQIIKRLRGTGKHEYDHVEFPGEWQPVWFTEATAEHISVSYTGGIDTLEPFARQEAGFEERGRLVDHRRLLEVLCKGRHGTLSVAFATLAHTSAGPNSFEWRRFNQELDKVWGTTHVLAKISRLVDLTEYQIRQRIDREAAVRERSGQPPIRPLNKTAIEGQAVSHVLRELNNSQRFLYDEQYWRDAGYDYRTPQELTA